jgi:predicted RNase H-like HicB family nuclease
MTQKPSATGAEPETEIREAIAFHPDGAREDSLAIPESQKSGRIRRRK